jgi:sorting nexin-1/2
MRSELERFEREKVEDFKSGVETYLESAVEAQKEVTFPLTPTPCTHNTHYIYEHAH